MIQYQRQFFLLETCGLFIYVCFCLTVVSVLLSNNNSRTFNYRDRKVSQYCCLPLQKKIRSSFCGIKCCFSVLIGSWNFFHLHIYQQKGQRGFTDLQGHGLSKKDMWLNEACFVWIGASGECWISLCWMGASCMNGCMCALPVSWKGWNSTS